MENKRRWINCLVEEYLAYGITSVVVARRRAIAYVNQFN